MMLFCKVLEEVDRVLKPGSEFIFTDPMQSDDCPEGVLQAVLDIIFLDLGFEKIQVIEMSDQLVNHYSHVLQEIEARNDDILKVCSQDYIERMKVGLNHWIESAKKGYLAWGILHFRKK